MKPEQVIAELFSLLRLLIERQAPTGLEQRIAALEQHKAAVEAQWPQITGASQ
jgi:hypothetical protein